MLLDNPTEDSVEVAVSFVTGCGSMIQGVSPRGLLGTFERFCGIFHEGEIDKCVQFQIQGLFALRKAKFRVTQLFVRSWIWLRQKTINTSSLSSGQQVNNDPEIALDIFKPDPHFTDN